MMEVSAASNIVSILGGQISTAVVTNGTLMPWFLFVEDDQQNHTYWLLEP